MEKTVQEAAETVLQEDVKMRSAMDQNMKNTIRLIKHFAEMQKKDREAEEERRQKHREEEIRRREERREDKREEDKRGKETAGVLSSFWRHVCVPSRVLSS